MANNYHPKATKYCVDCDCPATKNCRCCGNPLCGFCAKHDDMCKDCSKDVGYEYVADEYINKTVRAY